MDSSSLSSSSSSQGMPDPGSSDSSSNKKFTDGVAPPDRWCVAGMRPHYMTGFIEWWLKDHFANPENIEHDAIADLIWTDTPDTKILIESAAQWQPSHTEKRPAVLIRREDWNIARVGIDDRLMGGLSGLDDGNAYYETTVRGAHTLFVISNLPVQTEILASEVYRELLQFAPYVRAFLKLHKFVVVGVGAMTRIEEARNNYVVPVSVAYIYPETWRLSRVVPPVHGWDAVEQ